MLLAGNGTKMQQEISIPTKKDNFIISQPYPSPLPSPLPMTSHASTQPRGGSSSNNEVTIIRSLGPSIAKSSHNDLSHLSPLPSSLPMTSHTSSYPKGGSSSNNGATIIRSLGPSNVPTNHLESPIVATSVGSTPTNVIQPGIYIMPIWYIIFNICYIYGETACRLTNREVELTIIHSIIKC